MICLSRPFQGSHGILEQGGNKVEDTPWKRLLLGAFAPIVTEDLPAYMLETVIFVSLTEWSVQIATGILKKGLLSIDTAMPVMAEIKTLLALFATEHSLINRTNVCIC